MDNLKKLLAFTLVVLMLLPMLIACTGKDDNNNENEGPANLTSTESIVPEDVVFTDETFTVLCREDNPWGNYTYEIMADEGETELVNQAVYERNLEVEERFDLKIEMVDIPGHWDVYEDFVNTFKNSILSNSGSFDLIMSQQAYMAEPQLMELYYNFCELPYIKDNLDAPYYYQDVNDNVTIDGKLYYLLGDYSLSYWESIYVLYFNKKMAENHNVGDIYGMVKDGTWTFDKMLEMSKGVWTDLNGDLYPGEEDSFGYVTEINNSTDAFNAHFDVPMTKRDENGNIAIDIDQGKMINILEKFIEFKQTDDTWMVHLGSSVTLDENPVDKIFREDRALFYHAMLYRAKSFRGMETDFGIVPYPKWNEDQEGYYTHAQDGFSVAVAPIDIPNPEMTGAVLDVLSALSNKLVIPSYYDMALKDKYSRDDDSGEMLDIIREGFVLDFGYFYQQALGSVGMFRNLISQDNSNFASFYAINKKGYERNLNKLLSMYESME